MDFLTIVWTKFIRTWLKPKKQQPRNNSACRCFHPFDGNFTCEIINIIWINRLYCARKLQKAFIRSSSLSYIHSWWIHSPELYLVISFFLCSAIPQWLLTCQSSLVGRGFSLDIVSFRFFFAFFSVRKERNHQSTQIHLHFLFIRKGCFGLWMV